MAYLYLSPSFEAALCTARISSDHRTANMVLPIKVNWALLSISIALLSTGKIFCAEQEELTCQEGEEIEAVKYKFYVPLQET